MPDPILCVSSGMRKPLVVGLLSEFKNEWERRAALTPHDVGWLIKREIPVEVVSSNLRIFPDSAYRKHGANVVRYPEKANFLVGIKEPPVESLIPKTIYALFSHTAKGQRHNLGLKKAFVQKKITLIDYEYITDRRGGRLVYFGRFAGICGMIDCLHFLGQRRAAQGLQTPLASIRTSLEYERLERAKKHISLVARAVRKEGFPQKMTPMIVGILGHGNVSGGAQEILDLFDPIEIHPRDLRRFIRHQKKRSKQVYKIVFNREEKLRAKDGKGFYFEEYLEHPSRFESNMDHYLPYLNILLNTTYWDHRFPRLVPKRMIQQLFHGKKPFRLQLIGDLACEVEGTIQITKKVTNPGNPTFVFDPVSKQVHDGFAGRGVTVLAVDNLPCEFPREASEEFSGLIRDYIYQVASHGTIDVTKHAALPIEIRNGVLAQNGKWIAKRV